mgnify:CR=1 FL=1
MKKLLFLFPEASFINADWHWEYLNLKGVKKLTYTVPSIMVKRLSFSFTFCYKLFCSDIALLYSNDFFVWFVLVLKRIGLLPNLKIVMPEFNVNVEKLSTLRAKLKWRFISFALPACNCLCVFSELHKKALVNRCKKLKAEHVFVIAEPMAYGIDEPLLPEKILDKEEYVLFAGRTNRDLLSFLEATKQFNFPVIVISNDSRIKEFEKTYSKVKFVGEVSLQELECYIRKAKLYVVPLVETDNTSGLRIISLCFQQKTCVVATATAALKERFTDEIVYMNSTPNEIATQVKLSYYDDHLLTSTVAKASVFYQTKGSSKAYAENFQQVLDLVL